MESNIKARKIQRKAKFMRLHYFVYLVLVIAIQSKLGFAEESSVLNGATQS